MTNDAIWVYRAKLRIVVAAPLRHTSGTEFRFRMILQSRPAFPQRVRFLALGCQQTIEAVHRFVPVQCLRADVESPETQPRGMRRNGRACAVLYQTPIECFELHDAMHRRWRRKA